MGLGCMAVRCWTTHAALFPGGRQSALRLTGADAVAMGFVWLFLGVFLFSHYFMDNSPRLCRFVDLGKIVGLLGGLAALARVAYGIVMA